MFVCLIHGDHPVGYWSCNMQPDEPRFTDLNQIGLKIGFGKDKAGFEVG